MKTVARVTIAVPLALAGALWFAWLSLPWPVLLRWREPARSALMEQRIEDAPESLALRHEWVPLDRISRHLQRAVIVAEDGRFRDHDGVDWLALQEELGYRGDDDFSWFDAGDVKALAGSIRYYLANRDKVRGRSTITQQLAKNLYFSADRSLMRKAAELVVARRLERFLTKDRILELYLNYAEWGPGVFGAEAAAQRYHGTAAASLTRAQAAELAATLPHPLTSNPALRPGRMARRAALILARMGGTGPVQTVPLEPETETGADTDSTSGPDLLGTTTDAAADTAVADTAAAVTESPVDSLRR